MMHALNILGAVIAWLLGLAIMARVFDVFGDMIGVLKPREDGDE